MEMTVLKAKSNLSELLRRAESGEEVLIRRGRNGRMFRIVALKRDRQRTLTPDPRWKGRIGYEDADIWASEWKAEE
jgi:antitoxin (DNA-binding transcriptional repressor) of toxin-antitoxin stability system